MDINPNCHSWNVRFYPFHILRIAWILFYTLLNLAKEVMGEAIKEKEEIIVTGAKKGKRKWISGILNFLTYGGWLLVASVILGIVILISVLSK